MHIREGKYKKCKPQIFYLFPHGKGCIEQIYSYKCTPYTISVSYEWYTVKKNKLSLSKFREWRAKCMLVSWLHPSADTWVNLQQGKGSLTILHINATS